MKHLVVATRKSKFATLILTFFVTELCFSAGAAESSAAEVGAHDTKIEQSMGAGSDAQGSMGGVVQSKALGTCEIINKGGDGAKKLGPAYEQFIRDHADDFKGDNAEALKRTNALLAFGKKESDYNQLCITDMDGKEHKSQGVNASELIGEMNDEAKLDHQTNFGIYQISADRFALHPKDSLAALKWVLYGEKPQSNQTTQSNKKESNYFKKARQEYANLSSDKVDKKALAQRCGVGDQENYDLNQLVDNLGMAGQYIETLAKRVSGSKKATNNNDLKFFGTFLMACPRLNMELANNELKYQKDNYDPSIKENRSKLYFDKANREYLAKELNGINCNAQIMSIVSGSAGSL